MSKLIVLLTVAALLPASALGYDPGVGSAPLHRESEPGVDWSTAADSSSSALIDNYWDPREQYFYYGNLGNAEFHYWPQAHALDVMLDAYSRTGDPDYRRRIDEWYEGV